MQRRWEDRIKRLEIGERFVRRNPLYYPQLRNQLVWLEQAKLEERMAWTQARLREVLRAAAGTRYGTSVGHEKDVSRWPLLDARSVRDDPAAFHTGQTWFAAHASDIAEDDSAPLHLMRSAESVVAEQVCLDRLLFGLGVDPTTVRTAVLRGNEASGEVEGAQKYWSYALGGRRLILSSKHLSAATLPRYLQELRDFKPELLWVFPGLLELLCRLIQSADEHLKVPFVLSSSEPLQPSAWLLARQVLGCKVVHYYGQLERVAFASAFAPNQYVFAPGYSYLELKFHSADGGTSIYEIVGTTLWNLAMPLIRYRTGDLVRLPRHYGERELELVAWGMLAFEGASGRDSQVLIAPDRTQLLKGIDHIPHEVDHVIRVQVVQDALDRVLIRVVPARGFNEVDAKRLERNARNKIPRSIDLRIEVTEGLERTPQGKTPFIIHRPQVREAIKRMSDEL